MNDNKPIDLKDPAGALTAIMTTVGSVPLVMKANTIIRTSEKTLRDFIALHTMKTESELPKELEEPSFEPEVNNGVDKLEVATPNES